jgi:hypothetical protein
VWSVDLFSVSKPCRAILAQTRQLRKRRHGPLSTCRLFSSSTPAGAEIMQVFNRKVKEKQRDRAALDPETSRTVDYLRNEVANRLVERLLVRIACTFHSYSIWKIRGKQLVTCIIVDCPTTRNDGGHRRGCREHRAGHLQQS